MAKKLLAIALAASYLVAGNCRFVCALGMPNRSPIAAERHLETNTSPCHRQEEPQYPSESQKDQSAPCCQIHLDDISALLPADVALLDVSSLIAVFPIAADAVTLPLPRLGVFGEDRAPPLSISQILGQSSRGPRAPPLPTVVL